MTESAKNNDVQAPVDQIAPYMYVLSAASAALTALIAFLSVSAGYSSTWNRNVLPWEAADALGWTAFIHDYIPQFGSAVYFGWAVYFILSIRESRWSSIAIGVRGFALFCFGQAALYFLVAMQGRGHPEQFPSIIGHVTLGLMARHQWKSHGKLEGGQYSARETSVPSGYRLLAKGIGIALAGATLFSLPLPRYSWFPQRLLDDHWPFAMQLVNFHPATMLSGTAIAFQLQRCHLRRAWPLPLIAGLSVGVFSLCRIVGHEHSLSGHTQVDTNHAEMWSLGVVVVLWTVFMAVLVARLYRDDSTIADEENLREAS